MNAERAQFNTRITQLERSSVEQRSALERALLVVLGARHTPQQRQEPRQDEQQEQ